MTDAADSTSETKELPDDASYAWWRNTNPSGFVLAVRARQPPLLHKARCSDVDRDRRPGRLKAKGSRQICAPSKAALREWARRELPASAQMLDRCPKCAP